MRGRKRDAHIKAELLTSLNLRIRHTLITAEGISVPMKKRKNQRQFSKTNADT